MQAFSPFRLNRLTSILATVFLVTSTPLALAEKHKHDHDHDHEMEQHGSHEHGAARLTVAVTETGLEIALESPSANVFGFEHKAGSEEEHHIVHEADEKLKDGAALFAANEAAGCKLDSVDIESMVIAAHDEEKHGDHKHDDHDHDHDKEKKEKHDDHDKKKEKHDDHDHDDHKDEKHDDHGHDKKEKHEDHDHNKHDDHDKETHSDVDATWVFKCEKPGAIESVSTTLFSAFPKGFEHLSVEWITAKHSGKTELEEDGKIEFDHDH